MEVSETIAYTMWCPHARVSRGNCTGNRMQTGEPGEWLIATGSNCVGSACMAWRWTREKTHGYCGLAGSV